MTNRTLLVLILVTTLIAGGIGYTKGYKSASDEYLTLLIEERTTYAKTKAALQITVATGLEWKIA